MTGPAASARPDTAVHTPRARLRARSSSYTCRSIDRVPGSLAAAPRPMTARAAISTPVSGARAASTEPAQKMPTPASMTFLRPNSSATMPKASMAPANVSAYALTTHCSAETPACSSAWTLPRATLTTVLSRKVRNRIVHSTVSARAAPRRPAAAGRLAVAGGPADEVTSYPTVLHGAGRPVVLPPASSVSRPQKLASPTFQVPSCRTAVPDWPASAVWPASWMS